MGATAYATQESPIKNFEKRGWVDKDMRDKIDKETNFDEEKMMGNTKDSIITFGEPVNEEDSMGKTALGWTKNNL